MTIPATMTAVQMTGHGGPDKLVLRHDVPVPVPGPGEVLIAVTAAGMNNTDINTRIGWYNREVTTGTTREGAGKGLDVAADAKGGWSGGIVFPRIQGMDAVGRIAAVGAGVAAGRIGERVMVEPYIPNETTGLPDIVGSERDGGFAQYLCVPASHARTIPEDLSVDDAALATLPCSGGTAMNMALLAGARAGDLALVTGASGGVGSFLVQILAHMGAEVVAVAGRDKAAAVTALGAAHVVARDSADIAAAVGTATGGRPLTLIADVVGGEHFAPLLALLGRGGRYVVAGAIGGPIVPLDLRTLYLNDLTFFGSTVYREDVFPTLLAFVAEGGVRPAVSQTRPLAEIAAAQAEFLEKRHVGSMVLLPPAAS